MWLVCVWLVGVVGGWVCRWVVVGCVCGGLGVDVGSGGVCVCSRGVCVSRVGVVGVCVWC